MALDGPFSIGVVQESPRKILPAGRLTPQRTPYQSIVTRITITGDPSHYIQRLPPVVVAWKLIFGLPRESYIRSALTVERTLRNLYIDPLLSLLATQNVRPQIRPDEDYPLDPTERFPANGIFDTDPGRSLVLLLDFKSAGPATWWQLQSQLLPLREMGYLTHFNGTGIQERPITVVATGNAPFDHLTANETYRDVFFDAPLEDLIDLSEWWPNPNWAQDPTRAQDRQGRGQSKFLPRSRSSIQQASSHSKQQHCERRRSITRTGLTDDNYNRSNSLYASASFTRSVGRVWGSRLTQEQLQLIRGQVRGAHKLGLKVRYWDVPRWPVGLRNHIWHILAREGVDILNVDDLLGVGRTDWRRARTRAPEWPKF
ncbi:Altered inheritance of mitochondria protein 6 [Exophiala xenobiotica]